MATWGCVHGGKYGRVQAVINVALDDFSTFDTWCLTKGFDPLEVPGYRFYNAILAWIKDGLAEEDVIKIESTLGEADYIPHPFLSAVPFESPFVETTSRPVARSTNRSRPMSLEEQKRREFEERARKAQEEGVHGEAALATKYRVPDWWLGEEGAYKSSKSAQMGVSSLPKFG